MSAIHLLVLLGCRTNTHEPEGLTEREILTRASLDLRGKLPSSEEIKMIQSQPGKVNDLMDDFLEEDAFGLRIRDLFAGAYRTRSALYLLAGGDDAQFERDAGEEILKLIEFIVVEDRSFSEVVTADYTFATESMIEHWPISNYDHDEGGWQMVEYDDDRPHAGVMTTNSFHTRYLSNDENYHRSRANALSRILLCDNYLQRPIDFPRTIDLTDEDAINNAINENPACVSCHATLDPMASFLFGFPSEDDGGIYDIDRSWEWEETTGKAPSFNGIEGYDAADLGFEIAQDPRFSMCATRRVFEGLTGRKATSEDNDALRRFNTVFIESEMRIKTLIKSIVRDSVYRGRTAGNRTTVGAKIMSPEVLDLAIKNLTGYRMLRDEVALLRSDDDLHVLGGGLSHRAGDYAPTTSNVSRVLVQSQLAEAAANYMVDQESGLFDELFADVDMDADQPDLEVLAQLHTTILGIEVNQNHVEVKELSDLWQALVDAEVDPRQAWAGVVSVLLRDARFIHY